MKKIVKALCLAALIIGSLSLTGCGGEGQHGSGVDALYQNISGEWELVSWSSEQPNENIAVYISFTKSHTFVLYQKLRYPYFVKYTGSYEIGANKVISGVYDDRRTWGASYVMELSNDNNRLTLINEDNDFDVTVYARSTIPSYVIETGVGMTIFGERTFAQGPFL